MNIKNVMVNSLEFMELYHQQSLRINLWW